MKTVQRKKNARPASPSEETKRKTDTPEEPKATEESKVPEEPKASDKPKVAKETEVSKQKSLDEMTQKELEELIGSATAELEAKRKAAEEAAAREREKQSWTAREFYSIRYKSKEGEVKVAMLPNLFAAQQASVDGKVKPVWVWVNEDGNFMSELTPDEVVGLYGV